MSVKSDPVPPVPDHTPPLRENEQNRVIGRYFSPVWLRWFISLRDKVNVINESLINLIDVSGVGLVVKDGASWVTRTITGTASRVTVINGDGASGNPTIDVVTSNLIAGANVTFTGSGVGRIIGSGNLTINASGGGGGASSGGISGNLGSLTGSNIAIGSTISAISPSTYTLTGNWYIWCYPSGTLELDIWVDDFVNIPPDVSDSIVNSNYPAATAAITGTGDYTGWTTTTVNAGQAVTIYVRNCLGVKWFNFVMEATK